MTRSVLAALLAALLVPAVASARAGDPDRTFGTRGTVTLKATDADAVGAAVNVVAGGRVLAGGSAAGQLVVLKLRKSGSLDTSFGTRGQVVPALPGSSLDGVRSIQTFRDGRIVAAGTLRIADGTTRFVALRLLPSGEIDPSFGAGAGYVLVGSSGAVLSSMVMDRTGNIILAGTANGSPLVIRLAGDGSLDTTFGANGAVTGAAIGIPAGRATSVLVRTNGTTTFTVAADTAAFTTVRLTATGALDPTFGVGGVAAVAIGTGNGAGIGAAAVRGGPKGTTLVAGTGLTNSGSPRGTVIRLRPNGTVDTKFGSKGFANVQRSGRPLRITSMVRDSSGRILLAGTAAPPDSLVLRLHSNGTRDKRFANRGVTFPAFGQPPGGRPVYTRIDAIDASGGKAVLVGAAAGPGDLIRGLSGTAYMGRFALTVSRLR
jgi:uncharacterized delta-60 repeat protein